MKRIMFSLAIAVSFAALFSCKKSNSGPSPADNVLAYNIREIPVTTDYSVGAFYNGFGTFFAGVTETPVVGKYNMPGGVVPANVMTQHIAYAAKGGLDYFAFSFRSSGRDLNNYKFDSAVVKSFLDANGTANMKFALAYNWNAGTYGVAQTGAQLDADPVKLEQFYQDILRVVPLFNNSNYMKVSGKALLYIKQAQDIYANNNATIFATLRSRLSAAGVQLYIVGMQNAWTPPARYPFRFQNCVDAIYHQSFSGQGLTDWDRFYLLPQAMDQNWEYSRKYFKDTYSVDYVPNVSPAYNATISNPSYNGPVYARADSGKLYKQLCNVAKMNASESTRLILVDAFNDWQGGSQLEPANSYGELYLNITRSQFKKQ
jgi:hypothetical protein